MPPHCCTPIPTKLLGRLLFTHFITHSLGFHSVYHALYVPSHPSTEQRSLLWQSPETAMFLILKNNSLVSSYITSSEH